MYQSKIVSSLEKCFIDQKISDFSELKTIRMMKNQRLSFQLLYTASGDDVPFRSLLSIKATGVLASCAVFRTVEQIPVLLPIDPAIAAVDDNYLRTTPGLYPDPLLPLHYNGKISVIKDQLHAVWIEFNLDNTIEAGLYGTDVILFTEEECVTTAHIDIEVLDAILPPQEMYLTQWFHCDCLANYYHCEPWSERHWEIVENFATTAVRNGINMLLTPIFTPPLDTKVGGERLTTQLIDITIKDGKYNFSFEKLDRWIEMCDRIGIRYFEISHLFTQWGAGHAPKIMATVTDGNTGEYRRIFGWETEATGEEYVNFLRTMLPAFLAHMKAHNGDDKRCFFHISDEPNAEQLEQYQRSKAAIEDLLQDYIIMDALSSYDFYIQGVVKTPIPSNDHIEPFIEGGVPGLWTYYCCGQCIGVSNRLIAMPSWRNRAIGMQFYKYDIAGFLQWGYNFYHNRFSVDTINPYMDASGEYWVPAGDTYSVYPAEDGTAYESLRIIVFHEALEDVRAMKLCETFYGKAKVVEEMEKIAGNITFSSCPRSAEIVLKVRARIDEMIAATLQNQ